MTVPNWKNQTQARRRAAGLCVDCGSPEAAGRIRCPEHAARSSKSTLRSRARRTDRCYRCAAPRAAGRRYCQDHLDAVNQVRRERRAAGRCVDCPTTDLWRWGRCCQHFEAKIVIAARHHLKRSRGHWLRALCDLCGMIGHRWETCEYLSTPLAEQLQEMYVAARLHAVSPGVRARALVLHEASADIRPIAESDAELANDVDIRSRYPEIYDSMGPMGRWGIHYTLDGVEGFAPLE